MSLRGYRRHSPERRAYLPISLFVIALLLDGVIVRSFLWPRVLDPETVQRGSFHWLDGRVVLALDPNMRREMAPDVGVYRGDVLAIPSGRSVVLPLTPGVGYVVRNERTALVPYVILGERSVLPTDRRLDHFEEVEHRRNNFHEGPVAVMADPLVPGPASDDGIELVPWRHQPWRDDRAHMMTLARRCAGDVELRTVSVKRTAEGIHVGLGRCAIEFSVPADADLVVALVAGPDWLTATKSGGSWKVMRQNSGGESKEMAVILFVLVLVIAAGMGSVAAAATAAVLAPLSLNWPFQAFLIFLLLVPLSALAGVLRLARWSLSSRRRTVVGITMIALISILAGFRHHLGAGGNDVRDLCQSTTAAESGGAPACLVTGYSTANDSGIGFGVRGTFGTLDNQCPTCAGRTARIACEGQTFDRIRDLTCGASADLVAPNGQIVFLGGSNDDLMWPWVSASLSRRAQEMLAGLAMVFDMVHLVSPREFELPVMRFEPEELGPELESPQKSVFSEAAACAVQRRARLWVLHDFFASDLANGRSATREALLKMRRRAVEEHSGTLVDLFAVFRDDAGVAWFNDIIHLSAVGHQEVARLACMLISEKGE